MLNYVTGITAVLANWIWRRTCSQILLFMWPQLTHSIRSRLPPALPWAQACSTTSFCRLCFSSFWEVHTAIRFCCCVSRIVWVRKKGSTIPLPHPHSSIDRFLADRTQLFLACLSVCPSVCVTYGYGVLQFTCENCCVTTLVLLQASCPSCCPIKVVNNICHGHVSNLLMLWCMHTLLPMWLWLWTELV